MINNITQIIFVVSIGSIDAGDKNSHKYYLIYFSSLPYNIQGNKSVDGKLIKQGEMVKNSRYFSLSIEHSIYKNKLKKKQPYH